MKKMKYVFSFLFIFAGLLIVAGCATTVSANDSYVTLDINPSVELIVSPREKVVYANALNEDGEVLLAELDLVGLDLDDAIDLVIETAIELGYIDVDSEEVIVEITAISENSEIGETIKNKVKEHVNNAFKERAMKGRAEDKGYVPEFLEEAQSFNVSPGIYFMAQKAVFANDELTIEEAVELEVQELQAIIKGAFEDHKEVTHALKDEFMTARDELFDEYHPQIQDLEAQIEVIETDIAALETEIETLEADIEALEAQMEVEDADTVALQAEIDLALADIATLEAQIEAAEADLEPLQTDLEAIKAEFREKLVALRDEFREETEAMRNEMREMHQHRKEVYKDAVQEFKNNMQNRHNELDETIDEFQRNRP